MGVASSNPAFDPSRTPGVASACRPKERGADDEGERDQEEAGVLPPARGGRDAEPERRRRDCRAEDEPEVRRRWFSQSPSIAGRASRTARSRSGATATATQVPGRIHLKYPRALVSSQLRHEDRSSDSSELELPDGASGLDVARAIGPKLAERSSRASTVRRATCGCHSPTARASSSSRPATRTTPTRSTCCATRRRTFSPRR